jgi:hypothetical protein
MLPKFLRDLGHSLSSLYNLLPTFWHKIIDIKDKTLNLFENVHKLVSNVEAVVQDIRTFEINPKWNTRVISAPRVVDHIKELYDVPSRIITDVKDLITLLREKIQPTEFKIEDTEGLDGAPLKIIKVGEKILGFATLIVDSLVAIESALDDLNDIVDAIKTSLEDLKGLDALFLPQGNPKKVVDSHYRKRQRS